jgi:hypothetical protein
LVVADEAMNRPMMSNRSSVDAPEDNAPPSRRRSKTERQQQQLQHRLFNPDDYIHGEDDDEASQLQQQSQQHTLIAKQGNSQMREQQCHHGRVVSYHDNSSTNSSTAMAKSDEYDTLSASTPKSPYPYYTPKNNSIAEDNPHNDTSPSPSSSISSYLQVGLEEANLLARAMERRALLQDRIIAMETARAKLGSGDGGSEVDTPSYNYNHEDEVSGEDTDVMTQWQRRERRRRRNHRLEGIEGYERHLPRNSPERPFDESPFFTFETDTTTTTTTSNNNVNNNVNNNCALSNGISSANHHQRMNELSEQIKREAIDFMNYDATANSSRMKIQEKMGEGLSNNNNDGGGSDGDRSSIILTPWTMNGLLNGSILDQSTNDELNCIEEEEEEEEMGDDNYDEDDDYSDTVQQLQRQYSNSSPRRLDSAASIDTSAWDDEGDPTPQQLARYTNMVRVGIPDVAVLHGERWYCRYGKDITFVKTWTTNINY